ncbi:DNA-processing protein DprA [Comamonas aquatica]|uniref:DNA-processing protein DprA n=1 Tax=Comamonas aquatica TaxID=225991 RepID=UPI0031D02622
MEHPELEAWLRLSLTPGVGNAAARRLLARFGSAPAIFQASVTELQDCVSLAQAAQLRHAPEGFAQALSTTGQWLQGAAEGCSHALVTLGDVRYPDSLLHIPDPPLMLYVTGQARWLQRPQPLTHSARSLAMVGSRNPTPQGADNARQFAHSLADMGWCIVSGMALGIDAAAHAGALAADTTEVPTIAVVGTGVDRVYPRQHKQLAHQIAAHGLMLSEFPLGTPPIASNFPKRNRIISGLSCGTLVVEAALASGSLITARTASEQGREVFAIPGSIHAPQSRGCHALIQQGAKLVTCAQDILEELQGPSSQQPPAASDATTRAPAAVESPLLQAMGYDPIGLDALSARTGWGAAELQAQLLELELEGWLSRLPGGLFQRTAHG